jgi:hypothetical protein
MVSETERKKILEMIESGTISAEEGLTLLNTLSESEAIEATPETARLDFEIEDPTGTQDIIFEDSYIESDEAVETIGSDFEVIPPGPEPPSADEINKWKRWWVVPLWAGAAITVIGGLLMFWAFQAGGFGFWFACAWFPFLLGVACLALAWSSRTSPWLHVRVHQAPGERPQKIAISFPIPVRLTVWGLKTFGHFIPQMGDTSLDEVILALKDVAQDGTPLFVDVNEGEDGERVQVFIG